MPRFSCSIVILHAGTTPGSWRCVFSTGHLLLRAVPISTRKLPGRFGRGVWVQERFARSDFHASLVAVGLVPRLDHTIEQPGYAFSHCSSAWPILSAIQVNASGSSS